MVTFLSLTSVLIGFLAFFMMRGRQSANSPVAPEILIAKSRDVRLRRSKFTAVRGDLYLTNDQLIFRVNLRLVPMSYDNRQIQAWDRERLEIKGLSNQNLVVQYGKKALVFEGVESSILLALDPSQD